MPLKENNTKISFLWTLRLWVGRRIEPILGYVPKKTTKKRIQAVNG